MRLSSHEGLPSLPPHRCRPSLPQLDALATLVSTKCRAAFSQLGEHEVAVDVDELDVACWTQLMQLVRDPDRIPATEGPSRAVVRLKTVEPTRKHLWDTTEKKEKGERDALAEHVRHAAHEASPRTPGPRLRPAHPTRLRPAARHPARSAPPSPSTPPEQVRYVAKPLTGAHEAKHSDPGRPYLRDGVSSRETDWPAQFARAWGTRKSKLDPLGLVGHLCHPPLHLPLHPAPASAPASAPAHLSPAAAPTVRRRIRAALHPCLHLR